MTNTTETLRVHWEEHTAPQTAALCLMFELLEPFILCIHSSGTYFLSTSYESGPALDAGHVAVSKTRQDKIFSEEDEQ